MEPRKVIVLPTKAGILQAGVLIFSGTTGFWFGSAFRQLLSKESIHSGGGSAGSTVTRGDQNALHDDEDRTAGEIVGDYASLLDRDRLEERERRLSAPF